jgi:hypothetical protein
LVESSDNSACKPSNTSYNSYCSWPVENRILHAIEESEIELRPIEVAKKIHAPFKPTPAQRTTVRVLLRKLLDKDMVFQPYPGAYCNKITYGMRFTPLCVHNISLRSFICQDVRSWVKDEFVGGVKIHVCFGSERRKISGYIACDVGGMSHDACLLALNRWFDIVQDHLGWQLNDLEILTFECNKDYHGVRIDGVQCVTKTDLFGMVERVYQKEESLVRKERKITRPMNVTKFEEAISKGFNESEKLQVSFELREEVKRVGEALKFNNSRLLGVERLQEAIYNSLRKAPDLKKVENLEVTVEKIAFNVNKLTEVLGRLGEAEDSKRLAEGQKKLGDYIR